MDTSRRAWLSATKSDKRIKTGQKSKKVYAFSQGFCGFAL